MPTLKESNVIYRLYNNRITDKIIIDRTTKTKAWAKGFTFNIDFDGVWINKVGGNSEFEAFYLETDKLKEKYKKQLIEKFNYFDYSILSIEKIERILEIIK